MSFTIEGNDCQPSVSGGYLSLLLDEKELHIIGVPSPNLLAERHRDSVSENFDQITDDEGNGYDIHVWSSFHGVEWTVKINPCDINKAPLEQRLKVEYQPNDY